MAGNELTIENLEVAVEQIAAELAFLDDIAGDIRAVAVECAPYAEWDHIWWEEATEEEKKPWLAVAANIIKRIRGH